MDGRLQQATPPPPNAVGGPGWVNPTDNIHLYRPPEDTPLPYQKKKMDVLGRSVGWKPHQAAMSVVAMANPLTHTYQVVATTDGEPPTITPVSREVYRSMTTSNLAQDQFFGRRKGVANWSDLVHPFAANPNAEYRQGFKHESRPYHPCVGEMTAWSTSAFESKMPLPFTGKRPS